MSFADWWREEQRGQLLGHGIRWGNTRGHITKITDDGPGALGMRAICHGIQGVVMVNSGVNLDNQSECETWRNSEIRLRDMEPLDDVIHRKDLCPRCVMIYNRQRARDAKQ